MEQVTEAEHHDHKEAEALPPPPMMMPKPQESHLPPLQTNSGAVVPAQAATQAPPITIGQLGRALFVGESWQDTAIAVAIVVALMIVKTIFVAILLNGTGIKKSGGQPFTWANAASVVLLFEILL